MGGQASFGPGTRSHCRGRRLDERRHLSAHLAQDHGQPAGESEPADVAALAGRHPGVPIICGHSGGEWETGIRAIRHLPDVYADVAGGDPTNGFVEMAVRELGAHRVLYGSDSPGRSYASQLAKVMGADISEADRKLILGENLKRMMMPILRRKGIRV